jgi:hypothetical protein
MDASTQPIGPVPPPLPARASPVRRRRLVALGGVVLLLVVVRLAGPPVAAFLHAHKGFLPPCLLHATTGMHCPGCGSTRAVLALLEGEWVRAARNNVLLACAFPFLVGWGVLRLTGRTLRPAKPWFIIALAGLVVTYWILRNLPAFSWLAPVD